MFFLDIVEPTKVKQDSLQVKPVLALHRRVKLWLKRKNPHKNMTEKLDIEGKPNVEMRGKSYSTYQEL